VGRDRRYRTALITGETALAAVDEQVQQGFPVMTTAESAARLATRPRWAAIAVRF
jgi:hypothetical protein